VREWWQSLVSPTASLLATASPTTSLATSRKAGDKVRGFFKRGE
jgi:hypothetical protein